MKSPYTLTAIIATFNEERYIEKCLHSLVSEAEFFPKDGFEIIVADGGSSDKTVQIVREISKKFPFVSLIHNPKKIQSAGWNLAIKKAKGTLVSVLGAHSTYPAHYLVHCALGIERYKADVVGGRTKAIAATDTLVNRTIAAVLSHPFGSGFSFRTVETNVAVPVDTVFAACFTKESLEKANLFDEKMIRSQDFDLSNRIRESGGKIMLLPNITISYYPQRTLWAFLRHNWRDGRWASLPRKFKKFPLKIRHWAPAAYVGGVIVSALAGLFVPLCAYLSASALTSYLTVNVVMSLHLAYKEKDLGMIITAPIVFAIRHLVYGAGTLTGFIV